jgi:predicted transcriptional regulator
MGASNIMLTFWSASRKKGAQTQKEKPKTAKRGRKPRMRRSKLETYIDILLVLSRGGPAILTHIMLKANLNCEKTKSSLEFLERMKLIETRFASKKQTLTYATTQYGLTVLTYFGEIQKDLPIIESEIWRKRNIQF